MSRATTTCLRALRLAAALLLALAAATPASARQDEQVARVAPDRAEDELASARARWERLSPAEREELRRRFERFQSLDEAARKELDERARAVERANQRVLDSLKPGERARLDAMEPAQRRQILRELVERRLADEGSRLREKLPRRWRERLENATPEDRLRFLEQFKSRTREQMSRRAAEELGRALALPEPELQQLLDAPVERRTERVMELRLRLGKEWVEKHGLPPGLSRSRWQELSALEPEPFFAEVMALRESGEWRVQPAGGPRKPQVEARYRALLAVRDAMRTRPQDVLELSELSEPARRQELARLRRKRAETILEKRDVFPRAQVEEMRHLDDGEFFRRVREALASAEGEDASRGFGIPRGERREGARRRTEERKEGAREEGGAADPPTAPQEGARERARRGGAPKEQPADAGGAARRGEGASGADSGASTDTDADEAARAAKRARREARATQQQQTPTPPAPRRGDGARAEGGRAPTDQGGARPNAGRGAGGGSAGDKARARKSGGGQGRAGSGRGGGGGGRQRGGARRGGGRGAAR